MLLTAFCRKSAVAFLRVLWSVAVGLLLNCQERTQISLWSRAAGHTTYLGKPGSASPIGERSEKTSHRPRSSMLWNSREISVQLRLREQWDGKSLLSDFFPCLIYPHNLWCLCVVALRAACNLNMGQPVALHCSLGWSSCCAFLDMHRQ